MTATAIAERLGGRRVFRREVRSELELAEAVLGRIEHGVFS